MTTAWGRARHAVLLVAGALLGAPAADAHPHADRLVIRAARTFDGYTDVTGPVVVQGGRVVAVGPGSGVSGVLIEVAGSVLTPGLLDLDSRLGLAGRADEPQEASVPDLGVADAFAPEAGESAALARSGVTLCWLAPGPVNVVGPTGALAQPSADGRAPNLLSRAWGGNGSLTAAARLPDREPTSLPEQARWLRESVSSKVASPARPPTRVRFDDAASARLGLRVGGSVLVGLPFPGPGLAELEPASGLIVSGLGPATDLLALRGLVEAATRAVPIGFGTGQSSADPAALRWIAARAVQAGLPETVALSGLTGTASRLARAPQGRGTIAPGAAADLVLWSGDPLNPASRPLIVWVGGVEVWNDR